MIEYIHNNNQIISIIVRSNYNSDGIKFFTPDDFSQQLAYMNRERGYTIPPHVHNPVDRKVSLTQEVLYIKSGKVRVDYYNDEKKIPRKSYSELRRCSLVLRRWAWVYND